MKLRIREQLLTENQRNYIVESLLRELLSNSDIICDWDNYIPNFDETVDINTYIDLPIVQEIKQDVYDAIVSLEDAIAHTRKVSSVKITKSDHMGLSNYVIVKFTKPLNAPVRWSQRYKDLYHIDIKISDHFTGWIPPQVTHREPIIGKTLDEVKSEIMEIINNQLRLTDEAETHLEEYR